MNAPTTTMRRTLASLLLIALVPLALPGRASAEREIKVSAECPWMEFGHTLSLTEHGPRVLDMQTRLNWWNDRQGRPRIEVDGCFGAATERAVRHFQQDKGLPVTGDYDPCTRATMEGGSGCGTNKTTNTVPKPKTDAPTSSPTTTSPPQPRNRKRVWNGRCRIDNDWRRELVFCVDTVRNLGRLYEVRNGLIGPQLGATFQITDSNRITGSSDTLTRKGLWVAFSTARRTPLLRLQYAVFFSGGQAIHFYPIVAGWADSWGCVRTERWASERYWGEMRERHIISSSGRLLKRQAVLVHVF